MGPKLEDSIIRDENFKETPSEDKYGRYELNNDYVCNGQIMVTITLAEYRALLMERAEDAVRKTQSERYELLSQNTKLKKEVDDLTNQLNDMRSIMASAVSTKAMNTDVE